MAAEEESTGLDVLELSVVELVEEDVFPQEVTRDTLARRESRESG